MKTIIGIGRGSHAGNKYITDYKTEPHNMYATGNITGKISTTTTLWGK